MCGRHDESLVLDDIVRATTRLVELGARVRPGMLGSDRDVGEMVLWNLTVLGDASKRLSPEMRARFRDVPWKDMASTRDRVVHDYDGVVWHHVDYILRTDLPPLLPRLREIRDLLRTEFDVAERGRA